ncbi:endonuclease/exonuclease/phosphatase family protein [Fulvivirga sedimenti]|uniref:Endonuclease/exonuclease/phosphatase family protein n=1 Tax=Fulvivirga sedimenti TaxID=2879465 RepID=A0A9X1L2Z4_9BACT|nr:endonuclease/exonuclease/phosphatase family protein [Fulvivirga sedimenti]MCA6078691.1 endonuclease/exonuclease/phosphatase family protein [Fulvivirga sedimenti]
MTEIIALSLSFLVTLFVVTKMARNPHWAIRFFDFPQVQILVLCVLLLGVDIYLFSFTVWYHWVTAIILFLAIVYESIVILPFTPLYPKQVPRVPESRQKQGLSILISNVYMNNRQYDQFTALVNERNPDIFITLESDDQWEEALKILEKSYPYSCKIPLSNMYGMHLYSKFELFQLRVRYVVEDDVPSIVTEIQPHGKGPITLYAVHPKPPSPTENEESTERDGELFMLAYEIQQLDTPVIIAGDLNDVAWSRSTRRFQRLSRLLDPRIGRGFFNTFNAKLPLLRWPLDHVYHSEHFAVRKIERLRHIGSDHFPLFISLEFNPPEGPEFMPEEADEEDHDIAQTKIENAIDRGSA